LGNVLVLQSFARPRQQKLNKLEQWAKSKCVGLWKTGNPIPPWKMRKLQNEAIATQRNLYATIFHGLQTLIKPYLLKKISYSLSC
jgi:hypothetical protein